MKINLTIDGNYILNRNVFILKNNAAIRTDLEDYLLDDFSSLINSYPYNKIYFVSDAGKSWRKLIYPEYKDRVKDKSIDWGMVYDIFKKFKEKIINHANTIFLEKTGIEGDDFMSHTMRVTNARGESNILVSSDIDMTQELKINLNSGVINIQWNHKKSDDKVYVPENYQLLLDGLKVDDKDSMFGGDNVNESIDYINEFIGKRKKNIMVAEHTIFKKIVAGDSGDNIPGIIKLKAGKWDDSGSGIGEKGVDRLYAYYREMYCEGGLVIDFHSDEFVDNLLVVSKYHKKIRHDDFDDRIRANIKFNRSLVMLGEEYMPPDIYKDMIECFEMAKNRVITAPFVDHRRVRKFDNAPVPAKFDMISSNITSFDPDSFFEL